MTSRSITHPYFSRTTSAAPLVVFRIALGILLFVSILRFWLKGWIYDLYIAPKMFFPFYGLEFIQPIGAATYLLFSICALSAILVMLGLYYRVAIICLFLSFTYIELMDKTTYLNHYYFISMLCLVMVFLPAHVYFSFDAIKNKDLHATSIPLWCLDVIKLLVCLVYFLAGLAKINSDWLVHALPLRIWLPSRNDLPLLGTLFNHPEVAYAFSWLGCLYDLCIPFLLLYPPTRILGFIALVLFHATTAVLFPIGMFPYIMVATALIFFSPSFHEKILKNIITLFGVSDIFLHFRSTYTYSKFNTRILQVLFAVFFFIQFTLPFRYWLYPDELFWTEEGYRFSWRVMLMEKAGHASFIVKDGSGKSLTINNSDFLTPLQEKMMATQPDMILYFAHHLKNHFLQQGWVSPQVYADTYVSLNGRLGKPLIDPAIDLAKEHDSFLHKTWILPFNDEIKGF